MTNKSYTLKLKVGRNYLAKNGETVHINDFRKGWSSEPKCEFKADRQNGGMAFSECGIRAHGHSDWNLVREVPAPGFKVEEGKFYETADGRTIGPMRLNGAVQGVFLSEGKEINIIAVDGEEVPHQQLWDAEGQPLAMTEHEHGHVIVRERVSAGGDFFAEEKIRLIDSPVAGYRDIGEVFTTIADYNVDRADVSAMCVCFIGRNGQPIHAPAAYFERFTESLEPVAAVEVKADPKPIVVKVGGYYRAKNGVTVGPMVESNVGETVGFECGSKSIRQAKANNRSQWWGEHGRVHWSADGEEDHVLVEDLTSEMVKPFVMKDGRICINKAREEVGLEDLPVSTSNIENLTIRLTADTTEVQEFVSGFTNVIKSLEQERGQLQSTVESLVEANRVLNMQVNEANAARDAFREAFNVAAEGEATHRANERSLAAKLAVKQGDFARMARVVDEQAMTIDRLIGYVDDRNKRIAWLEGKLGRTKAWCEWFRKECRGAETDFKNLVGETFKLIEENYELELDADKSKRDAKFDAETKRVSDIRKGAIALGCAITGGILLGAFGLQMVI